MTSQQRSQPGNASELLPCPFCKARPGTKVGPPAMVRCVTPFCEGTKLAAATLAEWNTRATPSDGAREIEQLRRDLSHAKACAEVWMNRARKAEAAHECGVPRQPGNSELNELDRAIGIFGRATTETHLDPSDRYDAIKHVRDYLFGLRERLSAPAQCGVQSDYVLMPREPTREMWAAGGTAACERRGYHHDIVVEAVYRAMVEAAALSPEPAGDDLHTLVEQLRAENDRLRAGWQPIETAPHETRVLLGWRDWRDHQWCVDVGPAATGQRFANGWSNLSLHGSATHWMPLPAAPSLPSAHRGGE